MELLIIDWNGWHNKHDASDVVTYYKNYREKRRKIPKQWLNLKHRMFAWDFQLQSSNFLRENELYYKMQIAISLFYNLLCFALFLHLET